MANDLPPLPSTLAGALGRPIWNEARLPSERARLARTHVDLEPGRGRRVVLATGFMAGERSARPLADWLAAADYDVSFASMHRNVTTSTVATDRITEALLSVSTPAILIGHSRGGQQARVVTQRNPGRVTQLITLGAPVRAHLPRQFLIRGSVEALRLFARSPLSPNIDASADDQYEADLLAPFGVDVPWTSIWSKSDGVVEWQTCLDQRATSVEVVSSHSGLLSSVPSFRAIAAALNSSAR